MSERYHYSPFLSNKVGHHVQEGVFITIHSSLTEREAYCIPKSVQKTERFLTLWVDPFVENEFTVPEEVEQWHKVVRTAVNEVGTTRVGSTRPA